MLSENWLALTPALSPRRGGAIKASGVVRFVAALGSVANAGRIVLKSSAVSALPLLRERAGVRADKEFPASQTRAAQ
jgi:hypothetical protein